MLIVFLFIYKLENKYLFFKYTHDIDVPMHKAMLSDAKSPFRKK